MSVRGVTVICPACRTPWTALALEAVSPCVCCGHVDTQILAIVRDVDTYGVPRENPPRRAKRVRSRGRRRGRPGRRNAPGAGRIQVPAQVGHKLSKQVLDVGYYNVGSVQSSPYRHEFETDGVEMYALADGSLLIRHPKYRLWEDFVVPDNE